MNHRLIPYAIMGKEMWPKHESNARSRAIIEGEHNRILKFLGGSDQTLDRLFRNNHMLRYRSRRNEYANWLIFMWFTGASNTDAANMKAGNVKWDEDVLEYKRGKWIKPKDHAPVRVAIAKGGKFEKLLKSLPKTGNLFPDLSQIRKANRSRIFAKIIETLGIPKVTIHGYRFAFAERAKKGGMSAEDRMANLGHANYEMTSHYDKNAKVVPESIEVLDGGLEAA